LEEFEHAMRSKDERIVELETLLRRNGVVLGGSDHDLDILDAWFGASVEGEPAGGRPVRLRNIWYAVSYDIGLFLGELMIHSASWLEWRLYLPESKSMKSNMSFQNPVIQGFRGASGPDFFLHPYMQVGGYGGALVNGHKADPDGTLRRIVSYAKRIA
jgi:hypothetical protein